MEIWKEIKGYEGLYQVSDLGRVKSLERKVKHSNGTIATHRERFLKQEIVRSKYKRVSLSKRNKVKRFQVHRIVAFHFIKNPLNKPCVNHIDGNGFNNCLENLEWCTYSENEIHSYNILKKENPIRELKQSEAEIIREVGVMGINGNVRYLSEKYNVSVGTIRNVIKGKYYV